jgi:serine/threonine protein kinase
VTLKSQIVFLYYSWSLPLVLCTRRPCHCHPSHHSQRRWLITDFEFSVINIDSDDFLVSYQGRGTPSYRAPELISRQVYSKRSDSWSVGCVLFKVATTNKRSAFRGDWDVAKFALCPTIPCPRLEPTDNVTLKQETICPAQGRPVPLWEQINSILELCFTREPEQRATAYQLLERFENIRNALLKSCTETAPKGNEESNCLLNLNENLRGEVEERDKEMRLLEATGKESMTTEEGSRSAKMN